MAIAAQNLRGAQSNNAADDFLTSLSKKIVFSSEIPLQPAPIPIRKPQTLNNPSATMCSRAIVGNSIVQFLRSYRIITRNAKEVQNLIASAYGERRTALLHTMEYLDEQLLNMWKTYRSAYPKI